MTSPGSDLRLYSARALPHLESAFSTNSSVLEQVLRDVMECVSQGGRLLVAGSGHSGLFPLELYHRAGGVHFVLPVVPDYLLPVAGPTVVRALERNPQSLLPIFHRFAPQKKDLLWIASQSGINAASVELALEAGRLGISVTSFTSVVHSSAVASRHASGQRLFEVSDWVIDLGGEVGDASIPIADDLKAGPLSTLTSVFLGHSILVAAAQGLEKAGRHCIYTSVNTSTGEARNKALENEVKDRDFLLR